MVTDKKGIKEMKQVKYVLKHNEVCIHTISYTKGSVAHFHDITDDEMKSNQI